MVQPKDNSLLPPILNWERNCLIRGEQYRVIKPFFDADQKEHPVGEEWIFISSMFSKFDDEYILQVSPFNGGKNSLRLRCEKDQQDEIINHFINYVTQIERPVGLPRIE